LAQFLESSHEAIETPKKPPLRKIGIREGQEDILLRIRMILGMKIGERMLLNKCFKSLNLKLTELIRGLGLY